MNNKLALKYIGDIKIIGIALFYFASAKLGYALSFPDQTALPVWPPSGVAFALVILLGRSSWPGITIGAMAANLMAYWNTSTLGQVALISISTTIAISQTVEVLIGNYLIKTWVEEKYPFGKTRHTFRYLFVTLGMCTIGSGIGVSSLYINGLVTDELLPDAFFNSWVSHITGILLFTPFMLAITQTKRINFKLEKIIETSIFIGTMIGLYLLVKYGYFNTTLINSLPYLLIPFLLWMAFRFTLASAMTVSLAASILAIYFTIKQVGPFIQANSADSMLLLQIFISVVSISTIVLSATVAERLNAQEELKQFNLNLENRVQERTHALNEEIGTRRKAEDKLLRTNSELNKRNTELDNFVYSVSHDLRAPIASVLGLINLAREDRDPAMQQIYLDKISQSALQQDYFIKEILDHSRNSRLEVKKEEIQFEPLIDETFDQLQFAYATGRPVEKIITVKQDCSFFCDRWRLKVVLNNIISNSIRYRNGRDPVIKVNVDITEHKAHIAIEDNGRGIANEHLNRVCQMFYRATDYGAGSGLGLYIVKETIDKLHGSINIQSEVGKGTTVKLEIPELV